MKTNHRLLALICLSFFCIKTYGHVYEKRTLQAQNLSFAAPVIDGILDDLCWINAQWTDDFVQFRPHEGANPSQKTSFALLYDDNYLYLAFKAWDTAPDSIVRRMTRRDQIDGDYVGVMFDSYHDQRTAFAFFVSAAGVKFDSYISNDGDSRDVSWDPIWMVKTSLDSQGWAAEMRIPMTQLRFNPAESNTWGFQAERRIYRNDETLLWQPISRTASGWVHHMGLLSGLDKINPRKTFDLTPYAVSTAEAFPAIKGNPYATGSRYKYDAGLDGKIGLTNYLTLDFTINPDFGQVEADPSEVNLTAYESFYSERRPFFVEGRDLLSFRLSFGDGGGGQEDLFYSRRIGRKPQYRPQAGEDRYVSLGDFTPILGAAKIIGRTPGGLSIGLMQSVTGNQYALISEQGQENRILAEPFTSYLAARAIQDFKQGNTIIGIMGTAVNRNLPEEHLKFLHQSAYSGGIDLTHYVADRSYMLRTVGYFSHVRGSQEAILRTQRAPARYFQRPDAAYLNYDPERTSLTGTGGNIQFWKVKGKLRYAAALMSKSPQLEINDMGFMRSSDEIFQVTWAGYRITEPMSIIRSANININQWTNWNFNGESTGGGGNINYSMQFTNYWGFNNGINYNMPRLSASMLRGGPAFLLPASTSSWFWVGTSEQKPLRIASGFNMQDGAEKSQKNRHINLSITYRPANTLMITLSPSYGRNQNNTQYVNTLNLDGGQQRYILAHLDQQVVAMSLRVNYTITPELSLQFWGQPFLATGKYSDFKRVTNPRHAHYSERFETFNTSQITYLSDQRYYQVLEGGENNPSYRIHNPDFNVKQFLANMVVRWEYKPGSTLFFVWSQTRDHFHQDGSLDLHTDTDHLFSQKAHNVFMLKFTYRFGK